MKLNNSLINLLNIQYPILSAPMAGVSGGELACAVSRAGGLGLIGVGYENVSWLEQQLRLSQQERIGIGFITWQLDQRPELLTCALAANPVAIFLSFGDAKPYIDQIKAKNIKVICQVQTVLAAKQAAAQGADMIVAQGSEAGGHGATRGTFALIPAIVDAVAPIPVIAAGGIADGRGLAAALMLGAQGALVGTRFYASTEALGDPVAKKLITEASGDVTIRSNIFDIARNLDWPAPYTGRTLQNKFSQQHSNITEITAQQKELYQKALKASNFTIGAVFAGECVDLIKEILPAKKIVENIMQEAEQLTCGNDKT